MNSLDSDSLDKLIAINRGLDHAFPKGNSVFQMMTRLLEECGELAEQVHIFEDSGVKRKKHGDPDKMKLAKEIQDVMRCVMQVAAHYDAVPELHASINRSLASQIRAGNI